jgi:uncharacterized protein (TIRG00374 family)
MNFGGKHMQKKFRFTWQMAVSLIVSLVGLYFAVGKLELNTVLPTLRSMQWIWFIPATAAYLAAFSGRAIRWSVLLEKENAGNAWEIAPALAVGRAANNIFPWRLGEGVRVYLLWKQRKVNIMPGAASLVVERIMDGLTMVLFLTEALLLGNFAHTGLQEALLPGLLLFGAAMICIYLVSAFPKLLMKLAIWFVHSFLPARWQEKTIRACEQFFASFNVLRDGKQMLGVIASSILIWTCELAVYRCIMAGLGFGVSIHNLLLMSAAANLGTALPSGAANLGTFDAPGVWALVNGSGLTPSLAGIYMLILHAFLWAVEMLLGVIFLVISGTGWQTIQQASRETSDLPAEYALQPQMNGKEKLS